MWCVWTDVQSIGRRRSFARSAAFCPCLWCFSASFGLHSMTIDRRGTTRLPAPSSYRRRSRRHWYSAGGMPETLESYVRASLALQGYEFDESQIAEIVLQFSRIEAMARIILEWP